jgi:altronate dehydratase large subunit
MEFLGYERPDGTVGVRNYVALVPAGRCANELAARIADEVGRGVVALLHNQPCIHLKPDNEMALRTLIGLGRNANVAAAIVVGIGCEGLPPQDIADGIAKSNKPVELLTIDREGDYQATLDKGIRVAQEMLADASLLRREAFDLSHLILGTKCTGSTPASAMACNPVVGWAVDAIIAHGGSAVFSETAEIIGAEHILAKRAVDESVAQRIYEVVAQDGEENQGCWRGYPGIGADAGEHTRGFDYPGGEIPWRHCQEWYYPAPRRSGVG